MKFAGRELNCLSYWYPKIVNEVPTPDTTIHTTEVNLIEMIDGTTPKGFNEFISIMGRITDHAGYPCFLRTGMTSGKHEWPKTCFLTSRHELGSHVYALVEYSEMADLVGLPYNVWVVREMLPTKPIGITMSGMPVTREFRCFVDGGDVKCVHPYWPKESLREGVPEGYNEMCSISAGESEEVSGLAAKAGKAVGGAWSVDVLWTEKGWYVIDMARAEDSWHWPNCPNGRES